MEMLLNFRAPKEVLYTMFSIPDERIKTNSLREYTIPDHLKSIIDFIEMSMSSQPFKHYNKYIFLFLNRSLMVIPTIVSLDANHL